MTTRKQDIRLNYTEIRKNMLSESQIMLLNYIEEYEWVTASEVSYWYKISIQSASTRLKTLVSKRYLRRFDKGSVTGGMEYAYEIEPDARINK